MKSDLFIFFSWNLYKLNISLHKETFMQNTIKSLSETLKKELYKY